MDKVTLDAVMEEIKKSLGEARLMKIFEDDPEDKVIKQEPKTSATPSSQEDQNKTGTSPATAGSQPQSTMASPGDRAAFDKKTGADKARTDAGAAELAQRTLKPLVPGSSTTPSAPGAVRPLSAPSAPIKPITGPTKNDSDVKMTTTNGPGSQSQTSSWSGTLKPGESKTVGASASSSSSKSTGSNWSSAAQTAGAENDCPGGPQSVAPDPATTAAGHADRVRSQ
jgi:hypothetical protein